MRRNYFFILTITFFILIFRLYLSSQTIYFHQDIARDAYLIKNAFEKNSFIFGYGPKASVWNFLLPPFYYQINLFFSFITGFHPYTTQFLITVAESFTPLILFFLLKEFLDSKTAFFCLLLYAFSPTIAKSAINPWNPSMIPLFSTFFLFLSIQYLKSGRLVYICLLLFVLSALLHFHYQSVVLLPYVICIFLYDVYRNRFFAIKKWLLGSIFFSIPFLPYIFAEIQNNWTNTKSIIEYLTTEHKAYYDRISKPAFIFTFLPSFFERVLFGSHSPAYIFGRLLFFIAYPLFFNITVKNKKIPLFLYFLTIFIMLRVYKGDKPDYYMSTIYIFPTVLVGSTIYVLTSKKELTLFKFVLYFLLLSIISFNLLMTLPKKRVNEYTALEETVNYIHRVSNNKTIYPLFLHSNFNNQFAYGFNYIKKIPLSVNSDKLVIIGGLEQICIITKTCLQNPVLDYVNKITNSNKIKNEEIHIFDNKYIVKTITLENKLNGLKPYKMVQNSSYGNDLIPLNWIK